MRIFLFLFLFLFFSSSSFSMVVTEQANATQVGANILKQGGNAIDAAVAVGYALEVVYPCCGNIGGGGFMTIHLSNGKNIFINFREKAPLRAHKNMFIHLPSKATTEGYLAVAVPGTVLGLDTALQKYGTMTRQEVIAPSIQLAKALHKNDLANTLEQISNHGPDYFYKGPIAQKIVNASNKNNGILSLEDFKNYNIAILNPITCHYRGYEIISSPPPSSGGTTLCEMLNILENFPHPLRTHEIVEAMQYAFRDRNSELGDPDFVNNPVDKLISKSYAKTLSDQIKFSKLRSNHSPITFTEASDTTHYSIIDKSGNAVAVTYTLNGFFGSKVIAGDTGFYLNDEMDDFATRPNSANKFGLIQSDKNNIQPGKRPLSSMTPTIIMKNGKVYMILGSPGGPRIITAVLLTILNVIDNGMNIQNAVNAPRYHSQGNNIIYTEPLALSNLDKFKLRQMGYIIKPQHTWAAVEAILIDPKTNIISGANDKRRPNGMAIRY